MSETVSPNPSAPDGTGHNGPPKENPGAFQPVNDQHTQLPPYPTPNSNPSSAAGPSQPPNPAPQQLEQLPTPQQNAEPTRTPPATHPASVPPSLPPIQGVDRSAPMPPNQQQQQPPAQPQPQPQPSHVPGGQQMPANPASVPQMASMNQFYSNPPTTGVLHQDQMNLGTITAAGYQEHDKLLSGGRHKKEVKRRTKTGCLTCRKRRIKCDETHPVCRNCVKSKRECLGYDPVFRSQPAPSAIQPAPNPPPSLVVAPQNPSSYPPVPSGYVAASAPPHVTSLPSESPTPSLEQLEYATSAEPQLQTSNSPPAPPVQNIAEGSLQHQATPVQPPPPPPPVNTSVPPAVPLAIPPTMPPPEPRGHKIRKASATDLVRLNNVSPPEKFPVKPIEPSRSEEVKAVFLTYASGADRFLETKWYQEKALSLLEDEQRQAQFSGLIDLFIESTAGDPNVLARANSLEASVVWEFLAMCRLPEKPPASTGDAPPSMSPSRLLAINRLRVIEALVTGDYLDDNPVMMPSSVLLDNSSSFENQLRQREYEFWSNLAHFLTLRDGEGDAGKEVDAALARCRALLDTYENRDVIYSIAIARVVGQRWADLPAGAAQLSNGENRNEAAQKLYIAQRFLEDEASGKATTQVIKRVCGMVLQSWTLSHKEESE